MAKKSIMWFAVIVIAVLSGARLHRAADGETQAIEIINKSLTALGGQENLSQIHDYTIRGTAKVSVMSQGFTGTFTFTAKAPRRWRETFSSPYFEGDNGCDGTHLWVVGNGQVRQIGRLQQEIELEFAGMKMLTGPPRPGWKAKFQGRKTVSGQETLVIELTAPTGRQATYYIDAKTYLLVKSVVPAYNPMTRQETGGTTEFQKYHRVGKLMLPHWIFTTNGFLSKEIEVSQWTFNAGPSDSFFELPQGEKARPRLAKPTLSVSF